MAAALFPSEGAWNVVPVSEHLVTGPALGFKRRTDGTALNTRPHVRKLRSTICAAVAARGAYVPVISVTREEGYRKRQAGTRFFEAPSSDSLRENGRDFCKNHTCQAMLS